MSPRELVLGFWLRAGPGDAAGSAPDRRPLAAAGPRSRIEVSDGAHSWVADTVACGAGAPSAVAGADGARLLLAGELYERAALAAAVGDPSLATESDAALLLACWLRYGPAGFRLVNGRFAAVVADGDSLAVASDHAGSVPLYLRAAGDVVEIATEAKALAVPWSAPNAIPGAVAVDQTTGAHRVPAGTVLVRRATGWARPLRTWSPPNWRATPAETVAPAALRELLTAAVVDRLGADPAPTVVLSGGIDSSAVAGLATAFRSRVRTVSLGTDTADEFAAARTVATHLATEHTEVRVAATDLIDELPWAVWAAEVADNDILEYLLPLVALYRRLTGPSRRVLTGYGADIPLGGMHRLTERLGSLDEVIAADMASFDGLNELTPQLSGIAGSWTTHPYWDRRVLEFLVSLEPGMKRRHGRDKWVLRTAVAGLLPTSTVYRPKLGIHEGSGVTSGWTGVLLAQGVPTSSVPEVKRAMAQRMRSMLVLDGARPQEISFDDVLTTVLRCEGVYAG